MQSFCIDPVTRLKTNDMTTLPELVRKNLKTPYLLTEAQIVTLAEYVETLKH